MVTQVRLTVHEYDFAFNNNNKISNQINLFHRARIINQQFKLQIKNVVDLVVSVIMLFSKFQNIEKFVISRRFHPSRLVSIANLDFRVHKNKMRRIFSLYFSSGEQPRIPENPISSKSKWLHQHQRGQCEMLLQNSLCIEMQGKHSKRHIWTNMIHLKTYFQ